MIQIIRSKTYDTATARVVKKLTHGAYGDPAGFETTLYQTPEGNYFLYTYGGVESEYAKESITALSKIKATEFMERNQ